MTKVFQTLFGPSNGNCTTAVIASLLDLSLEEVPYFLSFGEDWFREYYSFLQKYGYEHSYGMHNCRMMGYWGEDRFEKLKDEEGVDGLFYASVLSPGLFNKVEYIHNKDYRPPTHAVIINKDFEIVHDPHPHYQGIKQYPLHEFIGYNGIFDINVIEKINK